MYIGNSGCLLLLFVRILLAVAVVLVVLVVMVVAQRLLSFLSHNKII